MYSILYLADDRELRDGASGLDDKVSRKAAEHQDWSVIQNRYSVGFGLLVALRGDLDGVNSVGREVSANGGGSFSMCELLTATQRMSVTTRKSPIRHTVGGFSSCGAMRRSEGLGRLDGQAFAGNYLLDRWKPKKRCRNIVALSKDDHVDDCAVRVEGRLVAFSVFLSMLRGQFTDRKAVDRDYCKGLSGVLSRGGSTYGDYAGKQSFMASANDAEIVLIVAQSVER